MNKLKDLITSILDDEQIIRFQQLEKIIDHNESINDDFNKLLDLQKIMVQKEFKQSSDYPSAKENYEKQLKKVESYPIISEYLDLLDVINNDLSMIKSIIEQEIAKNLD